VLNGFQPLCSVPHCFGFGAGGRNGFQFDFGGDQELQDRSDREDAKRKSLQFLPPPVISWFITPMNIVVVSSRYHKP